MKLTPGKDFFFCETLINSATDEQTERLLATNGCRELPLKLRYILLLPLTCILLRFPRPSSITKHKSLVQQLLFTVLDSNLLPIVISIKTTSARLLKSSHKNKMTTAIVVSHMVLLHVADYIKEHQSHFFFVLRIWHMIDLMLILI